MMRSPCCDAKVRVKTEEHPTATGWECHWYACTACGQPCDPVEWTTHMDTAFPRTKEAK